MPSPETPQIWIAPVDFTTARAFVMQHHRHCKKKYPGHKFSLGLFTGTYPVGLLVGVAVVGRPKARALDKLGQLEVTRVAVVPGAVPSACSRLYGACQRKARALGCPKLYTYTLATESGKTAIAANFTRETDTAGADRWTGSRSDYSSTPGLKTRWSIQLHKPKPVPTNGQ